MTIIRYIFKLCVDHEILFTCKLSNQYERDVTYLFFHRKGSLSLIII